MSDSYHTDADVDAVAAAMSGHNKARAQERYDSWHDIAFRMADRMSEFVLAASTPADLQIVAQHLQSAYGWRREYELAREQMRIWEAQL